MGAVTRVTASFDGPSGARPRGGGTPPQGCDLDGAVPPLERAHDRRVVVDPRKQRAAGRRVRAQDGCEQRPRLGQKASEGPAECRLVCDLVGRGDRVPPLGRAAEGAIALRYVSCIASVGTPSSLHSTSAAALAASPKISLVAFACAMKRSSGSVGRSDSRPPSVSMAAEDAPPASDTSVAIASAVVAPAAEDAAPSAEEARLMPWRLSSRRGVLEARCASELENASPARPRFEVRPPSTSDAACARTHGHSSRCCRLKFASAHAVLQNFRLHPPGHGTGAGMAGLLTSGKRSGSSCEDVDEHTQSSSPTCLSSGPRNRKQPLRG